MNRPSLTPAEKRMLWTIHHYIKKHGYSPSVRDLQDASGFSTPSTAQSLLNQLSKKGVITRSKPYARTLRIDESVAFVGDEVFVGEVLA